MSIARDTEKKIEALLSTLGALQQEAPQSIWEVYKECQ